MNLPFRTHEHVYKTHSLLCSQNKLLKTALNIVWNLVAAYNVKSHFLVHVYTQGVPQGLILGTLMFEEKWTTCIVWQDFNLLPWLPPDKGWTQQFAIITSFFSQYPCSMLNGWIASDWQPLMLLQRNWQNGA